MTWGFRIDVPAEARGLNIEQIAPFHGRVVTSGKETPCLKRVAGKPEWMKMRYGVTMNYGPSGKLIWNAKRESLLSNEKWTKLIRQRIVIPVTAFVESRPDRTWFIGERGWIPGFVDYDNYGGVVAITESNGDTGGSPIILDQDAAMAWLDASQWNALKMLDGNRVAFEEADVFKHAALDSEAACRLPIAA